MTRSAPSRCTACAVPGERSRWACSRSPTAKTLPEPGPVHGWRRHAADRRKRPAWQLSLAGPLSPERSASLASRPRSACVCRVKKSWKGSTTASTATRPITASNSLAKRCSRTHAGARRPLETRPRCCGLFPRTTSDLAIPLARRTPNGLGESLTSSPKPGSRADGAPRSLALFAKLNTIAPRNRMRCLPGKFGRLPAVSNTMPPLGGRKTVSYSCWFTLGSCQRSFNWQSTAFVMRGLWVRLPPLALFCRPTFGLPTTTPRACVR